MPGSTWTWIGGTINLDSPSDWTLTSGPGNSSGIPATCDTAINFVLAKGGELRDVGFAAGSSKPLSRGSDPVTREAVIKVQLTYLSWSGGVGTNYGTATNWQIDPGPNSAGATGIIRVDGAGAELSTLFGLSVGKAGQGIVSILNGGTVSVNGGGVTVGQSADAGASGTLILGGTGAAAFLDFGTAAGGLTVGGGSQRTLIVADNGTINLDSSGYLTIGSEAGTVGTAVVGGTTASAVINIANEGLTVGNAGTGYLTLYDHGTIVVSDYSHLVLIGQSIGAVGTMTVDGTSASITANRGIDIGWLGRGTLAVQNGATVNTTNLSLDGQRSGPLGDLRNLVSITTGGRLEDTGALYVWQGSTASVDSSTGSGIDVGTSGIYETGAIVVENGFSSSVTA